MPPGISACHFFPAATIRTAVVTANSAAAPMAHSRAIGGKPSPVTRRAVKIHT